MCAYTNVPVYLYAQTPDANATTDFSSDAAAAGGSSSAEVKIFMTYKWARL